LSYPQPRKTRTSVNRRPAAALIDTLDGFSRKSTRPGAVLVTLSRSFFRGEEERETGFRSALASMAPSRRIIDVAETDGLDGTIRGLVRAALADAPAVPAVYSIGGGNTAICDAFAAAGRPAPLLIAHTWTTTTSSCCAAVRSAPFCITT
jgi:ABC-type sugar transport system substrate-binding protein